MLKRRKWVLLVVAALGAVGGLAYANKLNGAKTASAPNENPLLAEVVVTVDPVTARPIRRSVTAVGSLWGWDEVPITAKVEGRVVRVWHDVGDAVKPGDVLIELDPTDARLAVAEARRALELELARAGAAVLPPPDFDVSKLPMVVRAGSLEKQAQVKLKRLRVGGRGITDDEMLQAETDVEVAHANTLQASLEAKATLAAARHRQAALESAEQRLADTRIVVPPPTDLKAVGGPAIAEFVISYRKVSEGEMVRIVPLIDAPPLFRLVIDRPLKLQLTVPERHRGEIKVGLAVELEVEAFPGETFAGTVARVNPAIERASRTFSAEVLVPNADRRLNAGSFAKATIVTKTDATARTVPEEAIVTFAGVTKVFTVTDGKAHEVPVKTGSSVVVAEGSRKRTWIEVEGDLPAKTPVITSGHARLAEGSVVRVR